ncbi:MAG TPA: uroporphyrinogen-III C-methyltransferase [Candidatus Margulisiibacteriota bacterium]|nr:uroporphyrinogen-III C-methyltransferase [Candidatus Margulisiibacteriota bacterium]
MAGRLYLVGAGPGDPGLLTLKGKRCLEQADVVIYDYLANPRLLDYARPDAQRCLVGKHGGGARVEQATINALIVEHAQQGKIVVRLKGGDPLIFGRGAEEAAAASAAGIEFEIVPGVSSAIAVPAYAGIPLTHRRLASNVIFTTGYEYPTKTEPAVHWSELARSGSTLVILMTQRQLDTNMNKLIGGGLDPETPVAVIEWGTRAAQRTVTGSAATIALLARQRDIKPPALAVVGAVVQLREQLNWFERKPLFGRRIMITRPRTQASEFADLLEAAGAEVVPFPTIETVAPPSLAALDDAIGRAREFDWVVFTSANGVRVFCERLQMLGADLRDWHHARFAAIGPQTAKALQAYCVRVDAVPGEYRAEAVAAALAQIGVAGKRILLPRAAGARAVLPQQLREHGATVEDVPTYTTVAPREHTQDLRDLLLRGAIDLVTFTSSSTVHNFVTLLDGGRRDALRNLTVGCIGPVTAETARGYGMRVAIQPETYTVAAFAAAIVDFYAATR